MRHYLLAGAALAVLIGGSASQAADLGNSAPAYKAPAPVPPVFWWTGFYVGGQGGYAWGQSEQYTPFGASTGSFDTKGGFGGGTVGYNWQIYNWVLGLEGDISGSDITGAGNTTTTFGCVVPGGCVSEVTWFGTARARLGYASGPLLLYGTAGAAFGHVHTFIMNAPAFDGSNDRGGWTAGAGVEYGFAPHWSAKLEYLHVDLGKDFEWSPIDPDLTRANFNLIRGGINYRF